jgi:hypothetical protein
VDRTVTEAKLRNVQISGKRFRRVSEGVTGHAGNRTFGLERSEEASAAPTGTRSTVNQDRSLSALLGEKSEALPARSD